MWMTSMLAHGVRAHGMKAASATGLAPSVLVVPRVSRLVADVAQQVRQFFRGHASIVPGLRGRARALVACPR